MARPKSHTDEVRERLLACAVEAAAERGIGTLALRELAEQAATSTSAVYSCFGSKEALQHAVLIHALTEFALDQESVPPTEDAVTYLAGLGAHYVGWAIAHPRLYEAMFGTTLAGIQPTDELEAARARAVACVSAGVSQALESGVFRPADHQTVHLSLWAQVHGLASLMIAGQIPDGAEPASAALATIEGWLAPS